MRSDAIECVGWLSIPSLIATKTAVITRYFATPLRSHSAIAEVDPDVIGRNHVTQGDPLLELSDGQILCTPCDGDLDWCAPVGTTVSQGRPFGQFLEEKELSSRTILVDIRAPWWPATPRANNLAERATISRWFTCPGEGVRRGDPLAEVLTDEGSTFLVHSPLDGVIQKLTIWENSCADDVYPGVEMAVARVALPPAEDRVVLGRDLDTNRRVTVAPEQLCSGCYILGVQGMGKSSLLEQIACQLLDRNESVIVFDPHGQLIDNIVARMPADRLGTTYHLDLKDRDNPFSLNVFACANPDNEEERDRTRNQVTHAFEKLWPETRSGVYFKKLLRHVIILLIEQPQLTLADVPRALRDEAFRLRYTERLCNAGSRDFWRFDYGALSDARQKTESGPLLTRIDELLAEPVITRILCQPQSTIDIRSLIEQHKNLLVRLPINEDAYAKAAGLVGTMLMAVVYAATFSFADLPEEQRPGFSLIVDEFQNFATDEYARLFAQGRKFGAKQFLAHQYRDQLAEAAMEANKPATLTAQTKVIFAVTKADAQVLADDFLPLARRRETVNLDMTPSRSLDRHANPVVKEFAAKYVWKLEAGADETIRYGRERPGRVSSGYTASRPRLDFGAGERSFDPAVPARALEVLNELLYKGQKERRMDEELAAKLLAAMKPLIGHDLFDEEVWDDPAHQQEYRRLSEQLASLKEHKPKDEIIVPNTCDRLIGDRKTRNAAPPCKRMDPKLPVDFDLRGDWIDDLCCPPWLTWPPVGSMSRYSSRPVENPGWGHYGEDRWGELVPYFFTGDPALIDVPFLDQARRVSDALAADARRMLADWLWREVTWWKNPDPKCWRYNRVEYSQGPGSIPYEWLKQLLEKERKGPRERWQESMRQWERDVATTQERVDLLVRTHRRMVPVEQKELLQFRRDLDHVLPALLEEPITLGQSKVTSKDVAQTLQHLPRRQAYVRIGATAHAMETLPLAEPVGADEVRRRFRQLQEQTRRRLCRHVSELGGGPDDPEAAGGVPRVDPRPPASSQPATEAGADSPSPGKPRLRRSRPLP